MRTPTMLDHSFIYECYRDWPVTENYGPITDHDVKRFLVRWMNKRGGEQCLINEHGFITWREGPFCAVVDNLAVHPDHRGKGHARDIWEHLDRLLRSKGVVVAEFNALVPLPVGHIFDQGIGVTGLPITKHRVT